MKKVPLVFLMCVSSVALRAQQGPLNSFSNAGGLIMYPDAATPNSVHVGVFGQPVAAFDQSSPAPPTSAPSLGTLTVSSLMFSKDLYPPVITFDPAALVLRHQEENSLNYQASDNDHIVSNKIFYKPIGSNEPFQSADAVAGAATAYSRAIATSWYDAMGMEYYIEARDTENASRHPSGAGRHIAFAVHPAPQIPTTLLAYGRTKNSYRIISVPFITTSPITQIFEELGPSDKHKYRLYRYESGVFKEYPSFTTLAQGEGYLIIMSDALSNVVLSMPELQAPPNDQSNLYQLLLKPGWNMIGNPYTVEINWDDVLAYNENPTELGSELKIWTEQGSYTNIKNLAAFQGAFVWLNGTQPLTLHIPFKGQTRGSTPEGGRTSREKSNAWQVNLSIEQGDDKNSTASFGMRDNALLGFDRFDDIDPPALYEFLTVKFKHPEHVAHYFSRDVVPTTQSHIWEFEIPSVNTRDRELTWTQPDATVQENLFLYDLDRNHLVDMRLQNRYTFPESSKNFKILYGTFDLSDVSPYRITVMPPYPNPIKKNQNGILSVGLPASDEEYGVQLEMFDAFGRTVYQRSWNLGQGLHQLEVPAAAELAQVAGEILYYQLKIEKFIYSGKIIYQP